MFRAHIGATLAARINWLARRDPPCYQSRFDSEGPAAPETPVRAWIDGCSARPKPFGNTWRRVDMMSRMRKRFALAGLAVLVVLLQGCGGGGSSREELV